MLTAGTRLGPYEITGSLGTGGMGEVDRARDTKLNRDVAIKVLPDLFALDPERLARFKREAQTLASLNLPNTRPVWSRDGRELFYRVGGALMNVEVRSTAPPALGDRKKLLDISGVEPGYFHDFDVSADGQRVLFIRAEPFARPTRLDVIVNWFPELARLVSGEPR